MAHDTVEEPDRLLLARWARDRDARAFREIVGRHIDMVYGVCLRILGNGADAEDAAQACFETLARSGMKPAGYLGAWLHRVATNQALQHLRAEKRRREREGRYARLSQSRCEPAWEDLYELVDEEIARLPEKVRGVIVGHFLEGHPREEIARRAGLSRQAVDYRINKGIAEIRRSLKERGIALGGGALAAMLTANAAEAAPAALVATLGKLALAGPAAGAMAGGAAISGWWQALTYGGMGLMKMKLGIALVVVGAAAGGFWWYSAGQSGRPMKRAENPPSVEAVAEPAAPESLEVEPPAQEAPVSAAVEAAGGDGAIHGVVRGTQGRALPEVALEFVQTIGDEKPPAKVAAQTGQDGRFTIAAVPPGTYEVKAYRPYGEGRKGHLTVNVPEAVEVEAGEAKQVEVRLDAGPVWKLTGRLVDPEKNPIPEAHIGGPSGTTCIGVSDDGSLQEPFLGGKGGRFMLFDIPEEMTEVRLYAEHRDYESERFMVARTSEEAELVMTPKPVETCEVRILNGVSGELLTEAEVRYGHDGPWVPTDGGVAVIPLSVDYAHQLYARAPGYQASSGVLYPRAGEENHLEMSLGEPIELHVYVDIQGPWAEAIKGETLPDRLEGRLSICARTEDNKQYIYLSRAEEDYGVLLLGQGLTYSLIVGMAGQLPGEAEQFVQVQLASDPLTMPEQSSDPVRVRVRFGGDCTVKGTIPWELPNGLVLERESRGQDPASGARPVELRCAESWQVLRGEDGSYRFWGLEPGAYKIWFEAVTDEKPHGEPFVQEFVLERPGQTLQLDW